MCQILMNVLREGFTESHANHHLYRWKLGSCGNTQTQVKKKNNKTIHMDIPPWPEVKHVKIRTPSWFPLQSISASPACHHPGWDHMDPRWLCFPHLLLSPLPILQCLIRAYVFPWCTFPCNTHIEHCRTALDTITTSSLPDLPSQLQSPPSRMSSITPSHFIISSHPTTGGKQALYEVLLRTQADFRWGTLLPQRNMLSPKMSVLIKCHCNNNHYHYYLNGGWCGCQHVGDPGVAGSESDDAISACWFMIQSTQHTSWGWAGRATR